MNFSRAMDGPRWSQVHVAWLRFMALPVLQGSLAPKAGWIHPSWIVIHPSSPEKKIAESTLWIVTKLMKCRASSQQTTIIPKPELRGVLLGRFPYKNHHWWWPTGVLVPIICPGIIHHTPSRSSLFFGAQLWVKTFNLQTWHILELCTTRWAPNTSYKWGKKTAL